MTLANYVSTNFQINSGDIVSNTWSLPMLSSSCSHNWCCKCTNNGNSCTSVSSLIVAIDLKLK